MIAGIFLALGCALTVLIGVTGVVQGVVDSAGAPGGGATVTVTVVDRSPDLSPTPR